MNATIWFCFGGGYFLIFMASFCLCDFMKKGKWFDLALGVAGLTLGVLCFISTFVLAFLEEL